MKVLERGVVRLVVVQHLRAMHGLKIKNWNKIKTNKSTPGHSVKVFGVALDALPHCHVFDYGDIPCFLVDACSFLMAHVQTEGLFRKSGSIVRLKALRAKLDQSEDCLGDALPLDVAGLLKQFFRELPEPILPTELHSALLKVQELPTEEERTMATILLSSVLPDRNLNTVRYFFSFLNSVAQRSAENKMDSSNLSVIFAPNMLHSGDGTEKMSASTEKKLKLQAAVVQCFIENASQLGVVPQFLLERVPALIGTEAVVLSPDCHEEGNALSGVKRGRRSLGDMVNGALNKLKTSRTPTNTPGADSAVFSTATPVIMTPSSKRKLPMEAGQSYIFSNKKRRSIKKNLGLELLPNTLFGPGNTPGSAHSAAGTLDSSHSALFSTGRMTRQSASSARRKSKRLSQRNINRVESGKAGCFSPRVTKKEAARKSLRMRFSLGKSSREPSGISHSLPGPKGSETIGWRLATQESVTSFLFAKDAAFSPAVLRNNGAPKGTKYISKSEHNLLTPQSAVAAHRTSWSGETPEGCQVYAESSFSDTPLSACLKSSSRSEPAMVSSKPPVVGHIPRALCCATSAESLASSESFGDDRALTGPTLLRVKRAFSESGSDLRAVIQDSVRELAEKDEETHRDIQDANECKGTSVKNVERAGTPAPNKNVVEDQNVTFGQIEMVPLSPLHIDSVLFESGPVTGSPAEMERTGEGAEEDSLVEEEEEQAVVVPRNCSQLIDALDIQSPLAFRLTPIMVVQSTPYGPRDPAGEQRASPAQPSQGPAPSPRQNGTRAQPVLRSPVTAEMRRLRVADHVQRFNMMTLNSPKAKALRSPINLHRTPVRQSVRRINSLLQEKKQGLGVRPVNQRVQVIKAVSLESGLATGTQVQHPKTGISKPKPPVPPKKPSMRLAVKKCALGDVTNKVPPVPKGGTTAPAAKCVLTQLAEGDMTRYRGSPKNPLTEGRLLSATKPIDL